MDSTKIDNFRSCYGREFIWFSPLTADQLKYIRDSLSRRLRINLSLDDNLSLLKIIFDRSKVIGEAHSADNGKFNLKEVLINVGVEIRESVFINWYRLDHVDELRTSDLFEYFHDLWYPAADDIEIFDESLDWVVIVTHYGEIRFLDISGLHGGNRERITNSL
jgi:hypothetical protein